MNQQSDYIKNTFNQEFKKDNFRKFLNNSFTNLPLNNDKEIEPEDEEYAGYINKYQKIAEYTDSERNKLAFLVVELKSNKTVERARSKQRNFAVKYLEHNNFNAGLISYYSTDEANWRFSLVKIDYKRVQNAKGEWTTSKEISSAKRYSFLIEPEQGNHTTIKQLQAFIATQNLKLSQIEDLFSVEKVTKEFYKQIAILFTKLVGGDRKTGSRTEHFESLLELPSTNDETIKKEFAVRLLGRTLFCWFLKKKKSNENISLIPDDLLSLKALKENSNYYHKILEPLFFQVLNREPAKRLEQYNKESWNLIPFLNGGLFEPHTQDYYDLGNLGLSKNHNLKIPDNWFEELFELFERYNFTIDESSSFDMEVSIDPEMLGRIFENLLAEINPETGESARKATGSYYTPRPIVEYMVDSSLKEYLKTATGIEEEKINNLIEKDDFTPQPPCKGEKEENLTEQEQDRIISALEKVKILDPACGSGAFPMGILQRIVDILQKIDKDSVKWLEKMKHSMLNSISSTLPYNLRKNFESSILHEIEYLQKKESPDYIRKKGIIQNSIYGLDIQSVATEIARLRFFLSLIVDQTIDENESNRGIKPLPNLEFKFVTANTLIGLNKGITQNVKESKYAYLHDEKSLQELQSRAQPQIQLTLGEDASIEAELESIRNDYFSIANSTEKIAIKQRFLEYQSRLAKQWQEKALKKEDTSLSQQLAEWNPFEDKASSWFDPEWMFGVKDGFDIVIGNPPYIRQEAIKHLKPLLEKGNYFCYNGTADIYVYFFEKSHKVLAPNGILCFITSNKYTRAKYGKQLREFILENTQLLKYLDFNGVKVFETATVDTSVIVWKKNLIEGGNFLYCNIESDYKGDQLNNYCSLKGFEYDQSDLSGESFTFANKKELEIKKRIEKIGTPLKDWDISIYRGVLTGYNEAFIINTETKERLCKEDPKSTEIIKPILRGRDIKRYSYEWADLWIIGTFPALNLNIDEYPAIKNYLKSFGKRIEQTGEAGARKRTGNEWFETQDQIAYWQEFEKEKIVYPCIMTQGSNFAFDDLKSYPPAPANIITGKNIKYIMACLNSKLIYFSMRKYYMGGGIEGELKTNNLLNVPIPKISEEKQKPFIELVERILNPQPPERGLLNLSTPLKGTATDGGSLDGDNDLDRKLYESIIDLMVYGLYFEESMKKHECYINEEITKLIEENPAELEKAIKNNKIIQRALIYSQNIPEIKIINGAK